MSIKKLKKKLAFLLIFCYSVFAIKQTRKLKMLIQLSLPVTTIKLFNRENNSVFEVSEMGKLNLKSAKEVAKRENTVLISKENTVQEFTIEPSNLTKVTK